MAKSQEWNQLSHALAPEIHHLVTHWDTLSPQERGELAGIAIGKCGADILLPGPALKALKKGIKGAKELEIISTTLKKGCQETRREVNRLQKMGNIERGLHHLTEQELKASVDKAKELRKSLAPFRTKYLPEMDVRKILHDHGVKTFPRPKGIPENYRVKISKKGGGMKYVHPTNESISVRVAPGIPHSEHPHQRKPYVIQQKHGKTYDNLGNVVSDRSPEAHIPIDEFIYREN